MTACRDPRSRRHASSTSCATRRPGRSSVAFHPDQLRAPARRGRRACARSQEAGLRARDRDQPAGAGQGTVLGRRGARARTTRSSRGSRRTASRSRRSRCACTTPRAGPGGDPVARPRVRLPKAEGRACSTRSSHASAADRTRSWMIGDSASDIEAGRAAGLQDRPRVRDEPLRALPASRRSARSQAGRSRRDASRARSCHRPNLRHSAPFAAPRTGLCYSGRQ